MPNFLQLLFLISRENARQTNYIIERLGFFKHCLFLKLRKKPSFPENQTKKDEQLWHVKNLGPVMRDYYF